MGKNNRMTLGEKMTQLTAQLGEQFSESVRLEAEIKKNFGRLGYDLSA